MEPKYRDKFNVIKKIVNNDAPTIVEVGSHYGEDTLRFLEVFWGASVFCFEADPRNVSILEKYVMDDHIEIISLAVSNIDNKIVDFYQSYIPTIDDKVPKKYAWIENEDYFGLKLNSSGASSLKKGYPGSSSIIKVKTIRLDTWVKERDIDSIDLLWIDVQGAEKEVLEGMRSIANRVKHTWIEYGESQYEGYLDRESTIKSCRELGFSLVDKHSSRGKTGDLLFRRK